jgi:SAM-dependent methyltransferase
MNELDIKQIEHHHNHYLEILNNGPTRYDGFINSNSIWYWMHVYCLESIKEFFEKIPLSYFLTAGDGYCGREASYIKQFGHRVHASDIETCLIEIAKNKNLIDEYSKQDMHQLKFEDNCFDYSLVKESLHHLSKPYQGLYELFRVSKNGVILIEPNGDLDKEMLGDVKPESSATTEK